MNHMKKHNLLSESNLDYYWCLKWTRITVDLHNFKKTFDKFLYQRLLRKLESYGIKEILGWIWVFLSNQTQQVTVNGKTSKWQRVTRGIPRGSVLRTFSFVIFINDSSKKVKSEIFLLQMISKHLDKYKVLMTKTYSKKI